MPKNKHTIETQPCELILKATADLRKEVIKELTQPDRSMASLFLSSDEEKSKDETTNIIESSS